MDLLLIEEVEKLFLESSDYTLIVLITTVLGIPGAELIWWLIKFIFSPLLKSYKYFKNQGFSKSKILIECIKLLASRAEEVKRAVEPESKKIQKKKRKVNGPTSSARQNLSGSRPNS